MTVNAGIWYGILDAGAPAAAGTGETVATSASGNYDNAFKVGDMILQEWQGGDYYIEDGSGFSSNAATVNIYGDNTGAYYTTATVGGRGGGFPTDEMTILGCIRNNGESGSSYLWTGHSLNYSFSYGGTAAFTTNNTTSQCNSTFSTGAVKIVITFASGRGGYLPPYDGDSMDWDIKGSIDNGASSTSDYNLAIAWTNNSGDLP